MIGIAYGKAVLTGQHQIENYQIDLGRCERLVHRLLLARSHHLVTPAGQKHRKQIANFSVVIYDQ